MKLHEVSHNNKKKGTYTAVHFDEDTKRRLREYVRQNLIPNALPADKYHTTITYSRNFLPDLKPLGKIDPPWVGTPVKLEVWESSKDDDGKTSNCLVLMYKCEQCEIRHDQIMDEHDATYDFDEYKTHITLSYDIGDMDISDLPNPESIGDISIVEEYMEELNLNWAKDNS